MDPLNNNPIASGSQMPPPQEPHKSSVGPIAGAIIIILLLVAGGLYFWGAQLNSQNNPPPYIPSNDTQSTSDATQSETLSSDASAGLPPQSSSDDVNSIQADANAMNTDQMNSQNSAELSNF